MKSIDLKLASWLIDRCCDANEDRGLTLSVKNVGVQLIPGDLVDIPHCPVRPDWFVIFGGSNDVQDWLANFESREFMATGDGRPGRLAEGFYRDYLLIAEKVLERLAGARRVFLAGHSKGHTLVGQLAEDLHDAGVHVECMTFGGPRWCDAERAAHFKGRGITFDRVVVGWDGVPRLPRRWMGAAHVGRGVYYSTSGVPTEEQKPPKWWLPWRYLTYPGTNHLSRQTYARVLRKLATAELKEKV